MFSDNVIMTSYQLFFYFQLLFCKGTEFCIKGDILVHISNHLLHSFIQREIIIKLCLDSDLVHYRKAQWIFTKYLLCQEETNDKLIELKRNKNRTLGKHRQSDEIESSSFSKRRRSSNDQNELKMLAYFATKMMVSLHAISTFAKEMLIFL